ncbi:hypothetical protein M2323_004684 [Rhodoblastus acidophilus]|nr:hypothetical protein [Rhodoblastus acidophilus]MCW2335728.1 hypothetical protein [Rhodoblastus acidophilus]
MKIGGLTQVYISKTTAKQMAKKAVREHGASGYRIKFVKKFNPDRTLDVGYTYTLYWE